MTPMARPSRPRSRAGRSAAASIVLALAAAAPLACDASASSDDAADAAITGPTRLSETGLYVDIAARALAPGVIPFAPAHPLWADGERKARYLLLPDGAKVDTSDMDHWTFPVGTKAWKEFWVDGKLVETRLLWKRRPEPGIESWWRVAYVWSADGRDAVATVEGSPSASGTNHDVPSQEDCTYCHTLVRDGIIGASAIELSSPAGAAAPAEPDTGLLLPLAARNVFTNPPVREFQVPGSGIVRDALGYLHGNCGFCHNARMEELIKRKIRFRLLTTDVTPEQTGAYTTTFYTKMFHVLPNGADQAIVPGEPEQSQAYVRMTTPDLTRMPPRGTKTVDGAGSALIREWILGLPR